MTEQQQLMLAAFFSLTLHITLLMAIFILGTKLWRVLTLAETWFKRESMATQSSEAQPPPKPENIDPSKNPEWMTKSR